MSKSSFEELHSILEQTIEKEYTNYRSPIGTRERLTICLRYLITGGSYGQMATSYCVGRTTVGSVVKQVSSAIYEVLQPIYLPTPTENTWRESEIGYKNIWNFPNCVATVDGRHVQIQCPQNSVKKVVCDDSTIVLMALADPNYKFIVVDIGGYGKPGEVGIFENSEFYKSYLAGKGLLPPKPLPNSTERVPHVIIGDESFTLQPYLMRPFPKQLASTDEKKKNFNERLAVPRRVIQNVFSELTRKFQIFNRPLQCNAETAIDVIMATCCLHNYILTKHENITLNESQDKFKSRKKNKTALLPISRTNQRAPNMAFEIREQFVNYFYQNK